MDKDNQSTRRQFLKNAATGFVVGAATGTAITAAALHSNKEKFSLISEEIATRAAVQALARNAVMWHVNMNQQSPPSESGQKVFEDNLRLIEMTLASAPGGHVYVAELQGNLRQLKDACAKDDQVLALIANDYRFGIHGNYAEMPHYADADMLTATRANRGSILARVNNGIDAVNTQLDLTFTKLKTGAALSR